ncbi:hypothetical protein UY3_15737 [Chelonia mydas]|uniref:Uncharacterized protein n=1 Tax=Chelonia mydas TaxID=8469 RepID=M7B4R6_CHEMY|nr:hypothetical protein UY3_15737 [Chelonia mydas]
MACYGIATLTSALSPAELGAQSAAVIGQPPSSEMPETVQDGIILGLLSRKEKAEKLISPEFSLKLTKYLQIIRYRFPAAAPSQFPVKQSE